MVVLSGRRDASAGRQRPGGLWLAPIALAALLLCCSDVRRYGGHGIVEDVLDEYGQVVIAHDEIRGLMPAMTMNFEVSDPALFADLVPGNEISFTLVFTGDSYRIVDVRVLGRVETGGEWARLGERLVHTTEAADFSLIDQDGKPFALADLAGKAVLLDFIFTQCPGPCPILTSKHVAVQRALSPEALGSAHLVSITLDPENDTPDALASYARDRGADLANWSFLTGPVEEVEAVIRSYAVGKTRDADGAIEHLVAAFLIDGRGRILERYLGLDHAAEEIASDLEALARNPLAGDPPGAGSSTDAPRPG